MNLPLLKRKWLKDIREMNPFFDYQKKELIDSFIKDLENIEKQTRLKGDDRAAKNPNNKGENRTIVRHILIPKLDVGGVEVIINYF